MNCIRSVPVAATIVLCASAAGGNEKCTRNSDRDALIAVENNWLKNKHNVGELEHFWRPIFCIQS
jgi:hypothetical protein